MVGSSQLHGDIDPERTERGIASLRLLIELIRKHKGRIDRLFDDERKTDHTIRWLMNLNNSLKQSGSIPNLHIAFEHQGIGFLVHEYEDIRDTINRMREFFELR